MANPKAVFQRHWDAVQSGDFDLIAADYAAYENGTWRNREFLNPSTGEQDTRFTWAIQKRSPCSAPTGLSAKSPDIKAFSPDPSGFRKRHIVRPYSTLLHISEFAFIAPEDTVPLIIGFDMRTNLDPVLVN